MTSNPRTARIRALNDLLRQKRLGGRHVITSGIAELGPMFVFMSLEAVREFSDFSEDNDPHGEHDFGSVEVCGIRVFWKIDYYDATLTRGAGDPSNQDACSRVMTIMLADEY